MAFAKSSFRAIPLGSRKVGDSRTFFGFASSLLSLCRLGLDVRGRRSVPQASDEILR
jgi:hypothetical protein